MNLVFATGNQHKMAEVRAILPSIEIQSLKDIGCFIDLPENQPTIEGNSLEKTAYVHKTYAVDCFGEDTGLEVYVLDGAPGVHSARYASSEKSSEANIDLLLKNLTSKTNRLAHFKTVITLMINGETHQFEGICRGTILPHRQGNKGFGYDSIFLPLGHTKSFAQMSQAQKNEISHRSIAFKKMMTFLKQFSFEQN